MTALRYLGLGVIAALFAACTTPGTQIATPTSTDSLPAKKEDVALKPLQVPNLDQLPETPARSLAAKYQAVQWGLYPAGKTIT